MEHGVKRDERSGETSETGEEDRVHWVLGTTKKEPVDSWALMAENLS
jgi:hypothetical protein